MNEQERIEGEVLTGSSNIIITCKIPKELVEAIDKFVEEGIFSSRSEAIRYAIGELVSRGPGGVEVKQWRKEGSKRV